MLDQIPFVQARYWKAADRADVKYVVIHTMELPCQVGIAERLADRMAALPAGLPKEKQKSAHYYIDPDEIYQGVIEKHVAFHCRKANREGIGIEHSAYAYDVFAEGKMIARATDFASPEALAMLERSAELVASICKRWSIPVVRLMPGQIASGRGIVGHVDVMTEFPGSGTHRDPGPRWPWSMYLQLVKQAMA